jgi:CTP:molybdopterin cytidylyltransferase MocA
MRRFIRMADSAAAGVAVAVLAAGSGSRFGGDKLDASCAGRAVGQWVLDAVEEAGLPPGLLVLPPHTVIFARSARGWQTRLNLLAGQGLGTSLAVAAQWALEAQADGLLVLLADMPLVDAVYLCRLAASPFPAATAHPGGRAGVPALLSRSLLVKAAQLAGDEGAARLLADAQGLTLLDPPAGMLLDVDRPEDRALAEERLLARKHRPPFRREAEA